jgi:hypothetical protein
MASKRRKKRAKRRKARRKAWSSRIGTLLTFLLLLSVLVLVVSTVLRWIVPVEEGAAFGRNIIRVEVLNGCGESGVAERVTDWLRGQGFDIVYFGNAESFSHEETLLLDRSGRPEFVREVAGVLGCDRIERRYDGLLLLDVTVIVGRDWRALRLAPADEPEWETTARQVRQWLEAWLPM